MKVIPLNRKQRQALEKLQTTVADAADALDEARHNLDEFLHNLADDNDESDTDDGWGGAVIKVSQDRNYLVVRWG